MPLLIFSESPGRDKRYCHLLYGAIVDSGRPCCMIARMSSWIKRLHMYAGLLNFSILLVFGIAGLLQTVEHSISGGRQFPAVTEFRDFKVPANLSDYQASLAAYDFLKLPLVAPPPNAAVHRDRQNNVTFSLYSVNGGREITLLEGENRVRIVSRRTDMWHFFDNLHGTTLNTPATDLRIRLWTWYNEFAIWSLIFMALSGIWLWLASRPAYVWAGLSFAAGSGAFLLLYVLTR